MAAATGEREVLDETLYPGASSDLAGGPAGEAALCRPESVDGVFTGGAVPTRQVFVAEIQEPPHGIPVLQFRCASASCGSPLKKATAKRIWFLVTNAPRLDVGLP